MKDRRAKAIFWGIIQISGSTILLYILLRQFSFEQFQQTTAKLTAWHIAIALLCFIASQLLTAYNWNFLLTSLNAPVPYRKALWATLSGLFYSFIIPSSFGSDTARAIRLYPEQKKVPELAMSIFLDRFTGLIVFALVLLIGFLTYADRLPFGIDTLESALLLLVAIGLFGLGILAVARFFFSSFFDPYLQLVIHLRAKWYILPIATLITLGIHILVALMLWFLCLSFWDKPDLFYCLLIIEILTLAEFLPISVAGLGVRESLYVIMLGNIGMQEADALAVSLAQFTLILMVAVVGGLHEARHFNRIGRAYTRLRTN